MRSYGPSVPSIANFFALVSENNRWYKFLSCIPKAACCFCCAGAFAAQRKCHEAAVGIAAASSARRYSVEPGPLASGTALTFIRLEAGING